MSKQSSQAAKPIDRVVVARLTGNLGDAQSIADRCGEAAALQCQLLADVISDEMQLGVEVTYAEHRSGLRTALVSDLGPGHTLASAGLRGWCPHFAIGIKNDLAIAMIAQLLGDTENDIGAAQARALSTIENDVAALLLARVAMVLKRSVPQAAESEPVLSRPFASETYPQQSAEFADNFAAGIRLQVKLGQLLSDIWIVIPQNVLLKTTFVLSGMQLIDGTGSSTDAIADHVLRSQVDLRARIRLTPLKLNSIARLKTGDIIPFEDLADIGVEMDANGKTMYRCEFGRSGDNYSVKIRSNTGAEGESLQDILHI